MSISKPRTRISRRTAVALATMSVVAAVAGAAPSVATAVNDSSSVARHAVAQTQNTQSAATAPNLRIKAANGITYQYRRFGHPSPGSVPLVFLQHYRGTLDNWDPKLIDTIAAKREVILVDNVGVGGSTGTTPSTIQQMSLDAIDFIDALKLPRYDLFGFSLGGQVAQEVALRRPKADKSIDGVFTTGSIVAESALTAADDIGRKLTIGSGDPSTKVLKDIEAGKIQYAMDQQPYLQTYYGVLIAKQYVQYRISPSGNVLTGPLVIDKDSAAAVLKINETYQGIRGAA
ncbi:alpha/beta fold hydrolase [Streptomyces mirabilis]|uniref:alpha/beta fold hydrolase n=1 Tax=Streptomyces mirabilis TaxID=68239 RepID=UPI003659FA0F